MAAHALRWPVHVKTQRPCGIGVRDVADRVGMSLTLAHYGRRVAGGFISAAVANNEEWHSRAVAGGEIEQFSRRHAGKGTL